MEQFSSFDRAVDNTPKAEKREVLLDSGEKRIDNQKFGELRGKDREEIWQQIVANIEHYEREKSAEEIEVIHDINNRTSRVIESYRVAPTFTVIPDTVHVIDARNLEADSHAFMSRKYGLFVSRTDNMNNFRLELTHEMFHYKGVNHLPVPLTEAIVERLTAQALNLGKDNLTGSEVFSGTYTYIDFRTILDNLLKAIKVNLPEGVTNDFHSFSFFATAHLTGSIEYLDFLNKIFSPDTLKKLQKLDDDPESLRSFVKSLEEEKKK